MHQLQQICTSYVVQLAHSLIREVTCRKEVCNELCIMLCSVYSHLCLTVLDAGANAVVSPGSYIEKIVWTNMASSDKALNFCWAFLICNNNELCIKLCSDNSHLCLTFLDAGANVVVSPLSHIEKIV